MQLAPKRERNILNQQGSSLLMSISAMSISVVSMLAMLEMNQFIANEQRMAQIRYEMHQYQTDIENVLNNISSCTKFLEGKPMFLGPIDWGEANSTHLGYKVPALEGQQKLTYLPTAILQNAEISEIQLTALDNDDAYMKVSVTAAIDVPEEVKITGISFESPVLSGYKRNTRLISFHTKNSTSTPSTFGPCVNEPTANHGAESGVDLSNFNIGLDVFAHSKNLNLNEINGNLIASGSAGLPPDIVPGGSPPSPPMTPPSR